MEALNALFLAASLQFGLPQGMLKAVCYVETKHDVNAVSYYDGKTHSYGICQVKLETARWLGFKGTEKELMKPKINIYYAGKYLAYQMRRYKNDVHRAITAYNRGNAKKLNFNNGSGYSKRVIAVWNRG